MSMLFTPYEVGNLHLENRIVLPPMATFGHKPQAGTGFVADSTVAHYSEVAKSRPGLMIVESTAVQPKTRGEQNSWEFGAMHRSKDTGASQRPFMRKMCHACCRSRLPA